MKTETSMAVRLDNGAYQGWQLDSENCLIVVSHTGVFNPCCTVETHLGLLRCTFAWVPSKPGETEYQGAELGHLYLVKSPQLDRNHREIPAHTYESVRRPEMSRAGEDVGEREFLSTVGGNGNRSSHSGRQYGGSSDT